MNHFHVLSHPKIYHDATSETIIPVLRSGRTIHNFHPEVGPISYTHAKRAR